jgi:SAM-dependent methyltransferase
LKNPAYALKMGSDAIDRLRLLAAGKDPSTIDLLQRIGGWEGRAVLDMGCGIGTIAAELSKLVGPEGSVMGIDIDPSVIQEAQSQESSAEYIVADLDGLRATLNFDVIFARYVFSHQRDPFELMRAAHSRLNSHGLLIIEDIDFDGHVCYPASPAFEEYVHLFKAVVAAGGGDACIGPKLPAMFDEVGFTNVAVSEVTPLFRTGLGKQIAPITLRHVQQRLIDLGIGDQSNLIRLEEQLTAHCASPDVLVSLARTFQVWGYVRE